RRVRACESRSINSFSRIPACLNLRESCIRETRTCSLSGGRRPARWRASSDPTKNMAESVTPRGGELQMTSPIRATRFAQEEGGYATTQKAALHRGKRAVLNSQFRQPTAWSGTRRRYGDLLS